MEIDEDVFRDLESKRKRIFGLTAVVVLTLLAAPGIFSLLTWSSTGSIDPFVISLLLGLIVPAEHILDYNLAIAAIIATVNVAISAIGKYSQVPQTVDAEADSDGNISLALWIESSEEVMDGLAVIACILFISSVASLFTTQSPALLAAAASLGLTVVSVHLCTNARAGRVVLQRILNYTRARRNLIVRRKNLDRFDSRYPWARGIDLNFWRKSAPLGVGLITFTIPLVIILALLKATGRGLPQHSAPLYLFLATALLFSVGLPWVAAFTHASVVAERYRTGSNWSLYSLLLLALLTLASIILSVVYAITTSESPIIASVASTPLLLPMLAWMAMIVFGRRGRGWAKMDVARARFWLAAEIATYQERVSTFQKSEMTRTSTPTLEQKSRKRSSTQRGARFARQLLYELARQARRK